MNPSDKKNLYTALDEMMDEDHRQPPAYQRQPALQNQQNTSFVQAQVQPIVTTIPVSGVPQAQLNEIMMVNTPRVGPNPMVVTCPHCRARSKTSIRYSATAKTHLICLLLSWSMCCCLPYCINSCRNANHYCSMCDGFIGTYRS